MRNTQKEKEKIFGLKCDNLKIENEISLVIKSAMKDD